MNLRIGRKTDRARTSTTMEILGALAFFAFLVLVSAVANHFAKHRIAHHIAMRGGRLIDVYLEGTERGWGGRAGASIYRVTYRDRAGNTRCAYCKSTLWSGTELADDHVIQAAQRAVPRSSA